MLDAETGTWHIAGDPDKSLTWSQVASAADDGLIVANVRFTADRPTFPFGTHLSLVEVDVETGKVTLLRHVTADDAGPVLNPILLDGQRHGGIAQGAAQALARNRRRRRRQSPLDLHPRGLRRDDRRRAAKLRAAQQRDADPVNAIGVKGIGEAGTIGATPGRAQRGDRRRVAPRGPAHRHADDPRNVCGPLFSRAGPSKWRPKSERGMKVELTVNGKEITADVEDRMPLGAFLRESRPHRDQYRAGDYVLPAPARPARRRVGQAAIPELAAQADGHSVDYPGGACLRLGRHASGTEGVQHRARPDSGILHARHGHGDRVGLRENPSPTEADVRSGPQGQHLPVHRLSQHREGGAGRGCFNQRVLQAPDHRHGGWQVIPPSFTMCGPRRWTRPWQLAAEHGEDAKYLAGGHSLLPLMKLRMAFPARCLIDLGRIAVFSYTATGDPRGVRRARPEYDAATSAVLVADIPLLAHTAGEVGDPQIRHRGHVRRIGPWRDPASDLPATLPARRHVRDPRRAPGRGRCRPRNSSRASSRRPSSKASCSPRFRYPSPPTRPRGPSRS